jgi:hypothetical protein
MKTALPENAKIAKEAKECMQECVSEFISFAVADHPYHSLGEVSSREAKDCEWRGYSVCNDFTRVRELRRGLKDLPVEVSGSEYCLSDS